MNTDLDFVVLAGTVIAALRVLQPELSLAGPLINSGDAAAAVVTRVRGNAPDHIGPPSRQMHACREVTGLRPSANEAAPKPGALARVARTARAPVRRPHVHGWSSRRPEGERLVGRQRKPRVTAIQFDSNPTGSRR